MIDSALTFNYFFFSFFFLNKAMLTLHHARKVTERKHRSSSEAHVALNSSRMARCYDFIRHKLGCKHF